jgi:hypothetical protein
MSCLPAVGRPGRLQAAPASSLRLGSWVLGESLAVWAMMATPFRRRPRPWRHLSSHLSLGTDLKGENMVPSGQAVAALSMSQSSLEALSLKFLGLGA